MPNKSRRGRAKQSAQSRKKGGRQNRPPVAARQAAVAQSHEPVPSLEVPAARASVPAPRAKPATVSYPYVAAELRTIAILTVITLSVLVVLAWVLS